jgi:hypothetical protein
MNSAGNRTNVGRPRLGEGGTGEVLGLRLSPDFLKRIDAARVVGQRTRSEAVRQWLERGLIMEEKMRSFSEIYRRVADSEGVVRFYFKPGIFPPGSFPEAVPGYKDPDGQWLDAQVLQFDEFGVVIRSNRPEIYIPWANIQQVTQRTFK